VAFFYDPVTQLGCHLLHITDMQLQFVCNLLIRYIQAHEIQTQYPYFQRLMMSRKNRVCQIVKPCMTVVTLIALTSRLCVIKATLDDLLRFARGAGDAVWPAQLADSLIALYIINQILDIDLHGWTPVRDRGMGFVSVYYPQFHDPGIQYERAPFTPERAQYDPQYRQMLEAMPPEDFAQVMRDTIYALFEGPYLTLGLSEKRLRGLRTPTLLMPGNNDIHPRRVAEQVHRLIPNARWAEVRPHAEEPDTYVHRVRQFLAEVEASGADRHR
jgi:hypothetical protein